MLDKVIKPQGKRQEGKERNYKNSEKTISKTAINTQLSITTLNVNGLHSIKRYRTAECIKKQDTSIHCLQDSHFRSKDKHRLKVKGLIQQKKYVTFINIHAPNIAASKSMKQILTNLQRETDNITILIRNFSTSLVSIDKPSRHKTNTSTRQHRGQEGQHACIV